MSQEIAIKEELSKNANNAVATANSMVVTDNPSNEKATNFLKNLKILQKEISAELRPGIEKAHETHRHLVSQEKRLLSPLQEAEKSIKRKVSEFLVKMENDRLEAQRKAQAKADKEERDRKEELERQAKAHEAKGNTEKAEERREQAEETFIPAPIVENKVEKQEGVSTTFNWKFEIMDVSKVPFKYLIPNEKMIGQVVRAEKDKALIPGVRIYKEAGVNVRV